MDRRSALATIGISSLAGALVSRVGWADDYAWIDLDGDGVLCTPTGRNELAGLTEAEGFPAAEVTVNVWLVAPCAGPDWFYPPASG